MWQSLTKVLKLLNSEQAPHQLSLGLGLAMFAGLTPALGLHSLVLLFLLLTLRANIAAFMLGWALFALLGLLLDPLFHQLGLWLLSLPGLEGMWTQMYNNSLWRLSRFNNTIMLGSLVTSLIALLPFVLVSNRLIRLYRERLQARLSQYTQRYIKLLKLGQFASRFSDQG